MKVLQETVSHFQHGTACLARGELHEAIDAFRRVLEIQPDHAAAHCNLACVFLQTRSFSDAEVHAEQALLMHPDSADVHECLGLAQIQLGKLDAAKASLRRSLAIRPENARVLCRLGNLYIMVGKYAEADTLLQQALKLDPGMADALYNLGMVRAHQGAYESAEMFMEKTIHAAPDHVGALIAMSGFLGGRGRFEEAEQLCRRALAINPKSAIALSTFTGLRKMTHEDMDWCDAANKLVHGNLHSNDEIALRFALGKYWDDLGDYDQAFAHYRRANELSRTFSNISYDAQARTTQIDTWMRFFDATRIRRRNAGLSDSALPVFVVGMPRSGTSLIEHILAAHPQIRGAGELNFWGEIFLHNESVILADRVTVESLQDLSVEYLRHLICFGQNVARAVDKMPGNFNYLGFILSIFPNAKIIHACRNPIDTCLSIYFQRFSPTHCYATDLGDLVHYYCEYRRLMAHWHAVLPPGAILDVPYESLVQDLEGWSRRMIDFIGMPWDDRCLSFETTERRVATASKWQVRQKIYTSSVERWRRYERHIQSLMPLQKFA